MVQECRRLRAGGPVEVITEVFGIGIDRARQNFALHRVGRFDDGLDGVKQFIDAGKRRMVQTASGASSLGLIFGGYYRSNERRPDAARRSKPGSGIAVEGHCTISMKAQVWTSASTSESVTLPHAPPHSSPRLVPE